MIKTDGLSLVQTNTLLPLHLYFCWRAFSFFHILIVSLIDRVEYKTIANEKCCKCCFEPKTKWIAQQMEKHFLMFQSHSREIRGHIKDQPWFNENRWHSKWNERSIWFGAAQIVMPLRSNRKWIQILLKKVCFGMFQLNLVAFTKIQVDLEVKMWSNLIATTCDRI